MIKDIIYESDRIRVMSNKEHYYVPGAYSINKLDVEWNNQTIEELVWVQKQIRQAFDELGIKIVGIYLEEYNDDEISQIIPFHLEMLSELNIEYDLYQPHISEYLEAYRNRKEEFVSQKSKIDQFVAKFLNEKM